jgi:hypothetical protein
MVVLTGTTLFATSSARISFTGSVANWYGEKSQDRYTFSRMCFNSSNSKMSQLCAVIDSYILRGMERT